MHCKRAPKKKKKRVQHRSPRSIADCRRTQMNSTAAMPHFRLDPPKLRRVTHTTPGNEQHASIDKQRWRRGQCGSPAASTRPEIPRRRARHLLLPLSLSLSLPFSRLRRSPPSLLRGRSGPHALFSLAAPGSSLSPALSPGKFSSRAENNIA